MEADSTTQPTSKRWDNLRKVLIRSSPFAPAEFEYGSRNLSFIQETCKVLVIGAGGLGCELLKDLAMMGFGNVHVIDMDTIDLSNLNRQFLFRKKDVGRSKAVVAATYINERVPTCKVTPHFCKIQDFDEEFYAQFNVAICGLDSIVARRWINGMFASMISYDCGELDVTSVVPLIDGGTEGFKGNARVILPGMTACIDCTLDLYPPQITYPLCTIASTPRLPEHCVEYAKVLQWPKENPFQMAIDGDDPAHIQWLYEKSLERAESFGIIGVTYRLVQGVVKNIIPAVSSTNAVIAAACATEAFKLATSRCRSLNNYVLFNDVDGIYTYAYEAEKKGDCFVCSRADQTRTFETERSATLEDLVHKLRQDYAMTSPGVVAVIGGSRKTLYMCSVASIEEQTRGNLKKTLTELGLAQDSKVSITDPTLPAYLDLSIQFKG